MSKVPRIKLLRDTLENLGKSRVILRTGEVCLIDSYGSGVSFDSLVIGDGKTQAKSLGIIPLNVSRGSVFKGIASPGTVPETPKGDVFYYATEEGTYSGFGNLKVEQGDLVILRYQYGGWSKVPLIHVDQELKVDSPYPVSGKAVYEALEALKTEMKVTVDEELSTTSENPIMNKSVTNKFSELDWFNGD